MTLREMRTLLAKYAETQLTYIKGLRSLRRAAEHGYKTARTKWPGEIEARKKAVKLVEKEIVVASRSYW